MKTTQILAWMKIRLDKQPQDYDPKAHHSRVGPWPNYYDRVDVLARDAARNLELRAQDQERTEAAAREAFEWFDKAVKSDPIHPKSGGSP